MAGFAGFDDYMAERTVNGKEYRADWVKTTGGTVHAASRWYAHMPQAGNPVAFPFPGTTKTFVPMDSTPKRVTTGSCNATTTITTTDTTGLYVGMLVAGTCNGVAQTAGTYITAISAGVSFTMSAVATGTGAIDLTCSFPTIWHGGNVSPDKKRLVDGGIYITAAAFGASNAKLIDCVGYYPISGTDVTGTTQRVLNNTLTLPRYTDGNGLRAMFVTTVAPTAGGPNLSEFTYVNQDGAIRSCPVTVSLGATPIVGHIPHTDAGASKFNIIPLAAGDYGIQRVNSFTFSGGTAYTGSGQMALVLFRELCTVPAAQSGVPGERNTLLGPLPDINDGACLDILFYAGGATTANTNLYGWLDFAWG